MLASVAAAAAADKVDDVVIIRLERGQQTTATQQWQ